MSPVLMPSFFQPACSLGKCTWEEIHHSVGCTTSREDLGHRATCTKHYARQREKKFREERGNPPQWIEQEQRKGRRSIVFGLAARQPHNLALRGRPDFNSPDDI